MSSFYDVLGVGFDADVDMIHRAYLARAQRLHPDRYGGAPEEERQRAEAEMKALNEAWNTLKNPDARHRYDAEQGFAGPDPDDGSWDDERLWPDEVWDDAPSDARPSFFRRTGVRLAIVVVLVGGLAGSGVVVLARRDGGSPPASKRTAASWSPSDSADLRSAAIRAGLSPTQADCFVDWITSRYRPSDQVDPSVIGRAADSCR
jgi:curved DNA-binding protein CbpA